MQIRAILFVFALFAFISVPAGGYLYYSSLKDAAFEKADRQNASHAENIKARVSYFLSENQKSAKALAGLAELEQALTQPTKKKIAKANDILDRFHDALEVDVCYLMDADGTTTASSNRHSPSSFAGKNYAFRPYFKQAIKGTPALYMAIGVTSGKRGVYYSHPVYRKGQQSPIGVVVIQASVERLEIELISEYPTDEMIAIITSPDGVIFITNRIDWRYNFLWETFGEEINHILQTQQFGDGPWHWTGLSLKGKNRAVDTAGIEYLVHQAELNKNPGWRIVHLSNLEVISKNLSGPFIKTTGYIILTLSLLIGLAVFLLYNKASDDIAQLKTTEKALKESESVLRTVINSMNDALVAINQDGHVTIFNPAAEAMFRRNKQEMIDGPLDDLMPDHFVERHREYIKSYFATGRPRNAIGRTLELQAIRSDGNVFPMEISLAPVSYGNKQFVIASARDISARKQTEAELRQSRENYRAIFDAANDIIFIHDLENGKILDVNERIKNIYGYKPEEVMGIDVEVISSGEPPYTQQAWLKFIRSATEGKPQLFEWMAKSKDSRLFWVEINLKRAVIGGKDRLLAVVRDINQRKSAEEERKRLRVQVQQVQKMESIGTLAGGIAHDFNNLLMGIQGNVSLLLYDIDYTHPNYEKLKNIENQVMSGARLASQLLGYARKGKYQNKPVSLNQLVEETTEAFSRTKKEIMVQLELSDDLSAIEVDQGQIEQMLLNLYVNAADAMPDGGKLFLRTLDVTHAEVQGKLYNPKPTNYVQLTVTDTGMGMDKETQERIFEPFFTTKEMGRGTGLGLASVFGTIKSHGGYIDVDSEKGHGTTFNVFLPASEKKILTTPTPKSHERIIEGSGNILLVDDEKIVLDAVAQMLKRLGYTAFEAQGGHESVEIYKEKKDKIDLVILDMIMPEMSGKKVYVKMKEINPNVKILLASGYSRMDKAAWILKRGCDDFIQKPFSLKKLSNKLAEILSPN